MVYGGPATRVYYQPYGQAQAGTVVNQTVVPQETVAVENPQNVEVAQDIPQETVVVAPDAGAQEPAVVVEGGADQQ